MKPAPMSDKPMMSCMAGRGIACIRMVVWGTHWDRVAKALVVRFWQATEPRMAVVCGWSADRILDLTHHRVHDEYHCKYMK